MLDIMKNCYEGVNARYLQVSKFPKGENCQVPNTLLNAVVTYWKANYSAPPVIPVAEDNLTPLEKEAVRISVASLREYLVNAFNGDIEKCNRIKKTAKGKFSSPDPLVSLFVSFRSAASSTSSL